MATRSRTSLFLQYRQSFARDSSAGRPAAAGAGAEPGDEMIGLIVEKNSHGEDNGNGSTINGDMSSIPPAWTDVTKEVDEQVRVIKEKIVSLESFQKKRLMPGFEDLSAIEGQIESISSDISRVKIKKVATMLGPDASGPEIQMSKNVQTAMASKVQDLSQAYRKMQSTYMQKLQGNSGRNKSHYLQTVIDDLTPVDLGFNTQDSLQRQNNEVINKRVQEIDEIAKSIQELAMLFKDLQMMVIDQGTVLDRIDYNLEQANTHIKDAHRELEKGEKSQKSERKKLIILLLIVIVLCLIVAIIVKSKMKQGSTTVIVTNPSPSPGTPSNSTAPQ